MESPNQVQRFLRGFGWFMLVSALLLSLWPIWALGRFGALVVSGEKAEGVVTGMSETMIKSNRGSRLQKRAIVEFTTANGKKFVVTDDLSGTPDPYRRGQRVTVRYFASNPADAEIAGTTWFKGGMSCFVLAGASVLAMIGGVCLLLAKIRWMSSS